MLGATNIPLLNADIVTGIAMMLLFVKFMNLGFVTVLIAHITFDIPYVILNVLPKLNRKPIHLRGCLRPRCDTALCLFQDHMA